MVLYHGSPLLLEVLEPGEHPIFASHELASAIPFALPIRPDARGSCFWSMERGAGEPRVTIHDGWLDTAAVGYVYELASDEFEPVDTWQWICRTPVRPLSRRAIRAADYVHLIR